MDNLMSVTTLRPGKPYLGRLVRPSGVVGKLPFETRIDSLASSDNTVQKWITFLEPSHTTPLNSGFPDLVHPA